MMRRAVLIAGIAGCFAQRVVAQTGSPVLAGEPEASAQIAKIFGATEQKGLPTGPILGMVGYGVMLHSPPTRIVAAVQNVASRLEVARDALAPHPTMLDIEAGEKALSCKASADELRAVRAVSANQPLAVPLAVLSQLIVSGVPAKRAAVIVIDVMKRGASQTQLLALGNAVDSDVRNGTQALSALDIRTRGLNAVLAPPAAATAAQGLTTGSVPKKP
ncbi:MAG TPA: hypothetical protein VK636_22175 [Gemmatimonadaceae bacterium]|nr:hypothetical protein [Gemmatimonadaceae bacterium]